MEMPEGWIKLRKVALLESDKATPKFTSCFVNGLDLMKEMARDLKNYEAFIVAARDKRFASKSLKKFNEWK